jgi:GNAT superfamily N-acetyltransferase
MTRDSADALRIVPATERDVALIWSLIRKLAEYEKLLDQMVATEDNLRAWLFGERPMAEVLIAYWAGEPAGFALYFHNFSTFLGLPGIYLEDLFVEPEYRGKGIGKALLIRLAEIAKERGYGRIEWAVLDWNRPAIDFYRSLGAESKEEWKIFQLTGEALRRLGGAL